MTNMDRTTVQQIRLLAADMIQKANSGHPGLPLGAAPIAYALFNNIMKYDPTHADWMDRDRFVLSAGHGSALLYSLLYLFGYDVTMEDLQNFRQLGSRTPGHPEYWCLPGVETATGPLGAGFTNAVGMALAERHLAAKYGPELVDHNTFVLASDGDMEEGISSEAASFAGAQKLSKLAVFYDSNGISIEGSVTDTFTEDVGKRFAAFDWYVDRINGEDAQEVTSAWERAQKEGQGRPKLIICETVIGRDAGDKEGTAGSHGSPLGEKIIDTMRAQYGFSEKFEVKPEVLSHTALVQKRGREAYEAWDKRYVRLKGEDPERVQAFRAQMNGFMEEVEWPQWERGTSEATRTSSGRVLNALAKALPSLVGGSADLAPSNGTWLKELGAMLPQTPEGRNIHFGIREHAMGGIVNGMALHGGLIPFGATFLVFSDYMRGALRLSALMGTRSIWVFTHDSFHVGEDGPTHQPVEQIDALRLIPHMKVLRPADGNETVAAYAFALKHKGPSCIILSRQGLVQLQHSSREIEDLNGYRVYGGEEATIQLYASGSEVSLAIQAAKLLERDNHKVEVISVPMLCMADPGSLQRFTRKPAQVRLALEAGTTRLFATVGVPHRMGMHRFGESAPGAQIAEHLNFTPQSVAKRALELYRS